MAYIFNKINSAFGLPEEEKQDSTIIDKPVASGAGTAMAGTSPMAPTIPQAAQPDVQAKPNPRAIVQLNKTAKAPDNLFGKEQASIGTAKAGIQNEIGNYFQGINSKNYNLDPNAIDFAVNTPEGDTKQLADVRKLLGPNAAVESVEKFSPKTDWAAPIQAARDSTTIQGIGRNLEKTQGAKYTGGEAALDRAIYGRNAGVRQQADDLNMKADQFNAFMDNKADVPENFKEPTPGENAAPFSYESFWQDNMRLAPGVLDSRFGVTAQGQKMTEGKFKEAQGAAASQLTGLRGQTLAPIQQRIDVENARRKAERDQVIQDISEKTLQEMATKDVPIETLRSLSKEIPIQQFVSPDVYESVDVADMQNEDELRVLQRIDDILGIKGNYGTKNPTGNPNFVDLVAYRDAISKARQKWLDSLYADPTLAPNLGTLQVQQSGIKDPNGRVPINTGDSPILPGQIALDPKFRRY